MSDQLYVAERLQLLFKQIKK